MTMPEWKPIPRHIKTDTSDTDTAWGVFGLLGAAVLVVIGLLLFLAVVTGLVR